MDTSTLPIKDTLKPSQERESDNGDGSDEVNHRHTHRSRHVVWDTCVRISWRCVQHFIRCLRSFVNALTFVHGTENTSECDKALSFPVHNNIHCFTDVQDGVLTRTCVTQTGSKPLFCVTSRVRISERDYYTGDNDYKQDRLG